MKIIAISLASLLLIPLFVISAVGSAFADSSTEPWATGVETGSAAELSTLDAGDLAGRILNHPRIHLTAAARRDVEAGGIDPRVLQVLLILAERHDLGRVGPFASGHSYFVKGTLRASNHVFGRAVDISVVDGSPVSRLNDSAYEAAQTIASLVPPLRPDELGAPWKVPAGGVYSFTKDHADHLHIGFGPKP